MNAIPGSLFVIPQQFQRTSAQVPQGAAAPDETPAEELTDAQQALQTLEEAAESQNSGQQSGLVLTEEEERIVRDLRETDREVRAHEQAHVAAAGGYAGSPRYVTVTGPDGREYAVSGEVDIDASPIPGNPEATIRKLDIVIRAALAPAQPSPQDFAVARAAQQARAEAQRELNEQRRAEQEEARESNPSPLDIPEFDPNNPTPDQQQQISSLIQGLNQASQLSQTFSGTLFDAIN